MKYRPDIDGLRAISVIAVLLFHYEFALFSGGYVGVDVFFVISGYLIIKILYSEANDGTLSFWRFYDRRIRRLFPALGAVMTFCFAMAYFLMLPRDFEIFGLSAFAAALSFSNFVFWRSGSSYFAEDSDFFPLLHTWSLSVEEQFYLIAPLIIWYCVTRLKQYFHKIFAAVFIASFLLSAWGAYAMPGATFYLLPTRAWELMFGGVLAIGMIPSPKTGQARTIASVVGIALIVAPIFLYWKGMTFPGFAALPPCLGAVLVIWSGQGNQKSMNVVSRILSLKLPVAIGLISYSLYLWHWPVIVFAKYAATDPLGLSEKTLLIGASFALSYASWRWIETPLRRGDILWKTVRHRFLSVATGAVVFSLTGIAIWQLDGAPKRLPDNVLELSAQSGDWSIYGRRCLAENDGNMTFEDTCVFGPESGLPIVIFSDSHGVSLGHALAEEDGGPNARVRLVAARSCPPALDYFEAGDGCANHVSKMVAELETLPPTKIVLAAYFFKWQQEQQPETFWAGFRVVTQKLKSAGHDVVIIGPVPPHDYRSLPPNLAIWARLGRDPSDFRYKVDSEVRNRIDAKLQALSKAEDIPVISLEDYVCPRENSCVGVMDGVLVYSDKHHYTVTMAGKLVRDVIAPVLQTIN